MSDKKVLTREEAVVEGMQAVLDEKMPNGELRFRRMHTDGSGYIRTEAPDGPTAWQNARFHKCAHELYVVQRGSITIAWLDPSGNMHTRSLQEEDSHILSPGVPHNVFMKPGSVIHTLKYGKGIPEKDWYESPSLDKLSKELFV